MAMNHDEREDGLRKSSSLEGDQLTPPTRSGTSGGKKNRDKQGDRTLPGREKSVWQGIVVDLVILLVLVGVGFGVWFAYDAVKEIYTPEWVLTDVTFSVEIRNIDYDRADELLHTLSGGTLWYSDAADGQALGEVVDVRAVPAVTEDGKETMTLFLTVEAQAEYRKHEGYYVGAVRLLAGESGVYRVQGLIAEGTIVSLKDPTQLTETEEVGA